MGPFSNIGKFIILLIVLNTFSIQIHLTNGQNQCSNNEYKCDDDTCIYKSLKCDGNYDCSDGDDEANCLCPDDEFRCKGGECLPNSRICDGTQDCQFNDDEENCEADTSCTEDEFECDDTTCIPRLDVCNGHQDCPNNEDESSETCNCRSDQFKCGGGQCIDIEKKCNDIPDCYDHSDEDDCHKEADNNICGQDDWECKNGQCIDKFDVCNSRFDCQDRSDEVNCTCRTDEFQCYRGGECIPMSHRCDGKIDCYDESDEDDCVQCRPDEFVCDGSCLDIDKKCDGHRDCADGSDETPDCVRYGCPEFECSDGVCISNAKRCDGNRDCRDGSDEYSCPCRSNEFQCNDGSCIPENRKCNHHPDCLDGSDEYNCQGLQLTKCQPYDFRCGTGECIPDDRKCDRRVDCRDGSDERDCHGGHTEEPQRLNLKTYPNEQIIKERQIREGREVVFQCRDEGPIRARVHWTRANGLPLPPGSRDVNGRLEIPNIRYDHHGAYVCEAVGYPKSVAGSSVTVQLSVEKYNPIIHRPPSACLSTQATCMNGECIAKNKVCNGVYDCADGSDESSCSEAHGCEPNEFKCNNRRCILKTWRCDGENDCDDGEDEQNCATLPPDSPCRYDEYQCRSGQCIPKSFHCDSHPDCIDKSDEIGCMAPSVIQPPPPSLTLVAGCILNITCRATGVPTPLVVWRLNWGHVPEKCHSVSTNGFGILTCGDIQPIDSGAYSCEIINTMGTHFVSPDTILIVTGANDSVCRSGYFNDKAIRQEDCVNCFCFGVSNQCKSANLYTYSLNPPVSSLTVLGVEGPWNGRRNIDVGPYRKHDLTATRHGVQLRIDDVPPSTTQIPYYSLPDDYIGNQLKSYGGSLRYDIQYVGSGPSNDAPDVILIGNNYTLTYRHHERIYPDDRNSISAPFLANNWYKIDGSYASREEIMMALANINQLLIKLQYVSGGERTIELLNINMDSASANNRGLGSANLVEECRCPPGYRGLSCENCDYGYVRQQTGAWLGRCVQQQDEVCRPGQYGDPRRGIPCSPCPCPVPGNSFARTCSLDKNGEVICNCDRGYVGNRCQECAPGYIGNPNTPRGCYPAPSNCNAYGTERTLPDGRCICKPDVEGPNCDRCSSGAFYLGANGCIDCFCMGVSRECSSSSWYRDTVRAQFTGSRSDFQLVSGHDSPSLVSNELSVEYREVVYRNFGTSDETFYWSLPPSFLGNKITAYGGNLTYTVRYTPQPSGSASRNNSPDVVIQSGNKITLHHYRRDGGAPPSGANTYIVPIVEDQWQNYDDGNYANREHILMALADVSAIYIKATYTTVSEEAALSQVILDVASESNYGSGRRAWEVEQCTCIPGHQGLSCEDCTPGYYKGDSGLYLGLCEKCECNEHSDECDPKTGACLNCRHNTVGESCEYCAAGYVGNATNGTPYDCRRDSGSLQLCDACDQKGVLSCDDRRGCTCKENVVGQRCDQCRDGTFGLSERNPEGCTQCFCSGATSRCSAGHFYREQIPIPILDDYDHGYTLATRDNLRPIKNGFRTAIDRNEISYVFRGGDSTYYWSLPTRVLGSQILSYGGNITLTQTTEGYGEENEDQDVIIRGNGITLVWSRETYDDGTYSIPLLETHWLNLDRSGPRPASRTDFLTVLSNIDSILIRATVKQSTSQSSISDVVLDTAVKQYSSQGTIDNIEVCSCPAGYRGTSCEKCADLHYRDVYDQSAGLLGACKPCPCEHADSCSMDASRRIQCACKPGWEGQFCNSKQRPITEPPYVDPQTPSIEVVISSPTLQIVEVGESVRLSCSGYYIVNRSPVTVRWYKLEGRLPPQAYIESGTLIITNLQIDDSGIYVCEAESGPEKVKQQVTVTVGGDYPRRPQVTLQPTIIDVDEYRSAEVHCSAIGNPMPVITWERLDGGQISRDTVINQGYLRFNSLRKSDEGSYRCLARNNVGDHDQLLEIYVRSEQPQPPVRPTRPPVPNYETVAITPENYIGRTGDEIRLTCICTPTGAGRIEWSKSGEPSLPRNAYPSNEILIISHATIDNSGRYVCTAQFPSGVSRHSHVDVTVQHSGPELTRPQISPLEQRYQITQGHDFSVTCNATGNPYPKVKWTLNGAPFGPNVQQTGNVLRILNAHPDNGGVYICIAENPEGSDQSATVIDIERREPPVIELHPSEPQSLKVGESIRLSCRANSGIPYPTITWQRRDRRPLSSRITEDYPGVITFREVTLDDAGEYECRAENPAGTITSSITVEVQQQPEVSFSPNVTHISLRTNQELRLQCTGIGKPTPNVSIKTPYQDIQRGPSHIDSVGIANVHIYRVGRDHAGLYECVGTNAAGTDTKYIQVSVNEGRGDLGNADTDDGDGGYDNEPATQSPYPDRDRDRDRYPPPQPDHPTYRPDHHSPNRHPSTIPYKAVLGGKSILICNEEHHTETEWRRADGGRLPTGSQSFNGRLEIDNTQYDAAGFYECIAYDPYEGPFTVVRAEVAVVSPPRITFSPSMPMMVRSGENVIIYCNATGEQPISVTWHPEEGKQFPRTVRVSASYLQFYHITTDDAGRYYCSASNVHGNVTKVAEVIVNRNDMIPEAPQHGRLHEVFKGATVTLNCNQPNLHLPAGVRFEWQRSGKHIPRTASFDDNRITLHDINDDDQGRYICSMIYPNGTIVRDYVDVEIKPTDHLPVLKLEPSRSFLRPGDSLTVECSSSAGPHVNVKWERQGENRLPYNFRQEGNRLIITNAHLNDAGKYTCVCYTDDGVQYFSDYELNVENAPAKHTARPPKVEHTEVGSTVLLKCNADRYPSSFQWSRQHGSFHPDTDTTRDVLTLTDVQASDAGTYICTTTHNGNKVDIPTTLVVTGAIPFFPQSPKSYMAFNKFDHYSRFSFEVTFKPEKLNGLILYNGQRRGGLNGDYISLSLHAGYPQFRFDFGKQHHVLTPEKPITIGEWHTIKVSRIRTNGFMLVDDQHPVVFPPNLRFHGLNLDESVYLGNVPDFKNIPPSAVEVKEGFVGCISRLVLNEKDIQLNQEAIHVEGTTSCEPCADEPCTNDGVCLETQTENGYTCVCQDGFTGKNCQIEGNQCTFDVCGVGRCSETERGIQCYCPLNRTGDKCQYIEHYDDGILSFKDGSYAAYDKLSSKKSIKFRVRPENTEDAVLLYAAESDKAYGDFIAVVIKDKHVELRYNVGGRAQPTIVRSRNPIQPNKWTDISVGRSRAGLGYLQVGDEPQVNEQRLGKAQTMFLKTNLYVGGYDKRIVLNRGVGVTRGFDGCISGLEASGRTIDLIADIKDSANVQNCGHQTGSHENVHENEIENCSPGYGGSNCEIVLDHCIALEPCENGATCINERHDYRCDCAHGFTGKNCQSTVRLEFAANFNENGFLELDRAVISNSTSQFQTAIALLFSTRDPNGLILWYGQPKYESYDNQDFIALALVDGFLEYRFRLDSEEGSIKWINNRVDDGKRHVVVMKRQQNQASLEVDHLTEYGESRPSGKKNMVLTGHIFLGGAPNITNFTGDRYTQGFKGCIHIVESLDTGAIKLGQHTISSLNVDQCPDSGEDEVDLGTEPPVV
uniref:Putative heparan sulfate proteoglycan 2 n=1 Tax=Corethrella appendiculata TaxID=1370023 RepID=W4VRB4_9DIPT